MLLRGRLEHIGRVCSMIDIRIQFVPGQITVLGGNCIIKPFAQREVT
jgi:hypothetical protein